MTRLRRDCDHNGRVRSRVPPSRPFCCPQREEFCASNDLSESACARGLLPRDAFCCEQHVNSSRRAELDSQLVCDTVVPFRASRASPETSQRRCGMRRLRAWLVTSSREPRVTDRPYYGGPPFSGLTAARILRFAGASGCKPPVLMDLETDLAGRRCFSPGSSIAAVERREADVPRYGT
jgi:hypothetical protein